MQKEDGEGEEEEQGFEYTGMIGAVARGEVDTSVAGQETSTHDIREED